MPQVSSVLDNVQIQLHDGAIGQDGTIWSRDELLLWLQDGYRQLLSRSKSTHRLMALPVPPRHTFNFTHDWERNHLMGGTGRQFTYAGYDNRRQFTSMWEVERFEGLTPQTSFASVTQLWELAYASESDTHYRFALPKDHEFLLGIWYDHDPLAPISIRELDYFDEAWYRRQGDPLFWSPGVTGVRTYEIYYIQVPSTQAYALYDYLYGTARYMSGDRTYTPSTADGIQHNYAYTTNADAQALRTPRRDFLPRAAITTPGEIGGDHQNQNYMPFYTFTLDLGNGYRGTQPWEVAPNSSTATGYRLGQFPWEKDHGATVPSQTTKPVGGGIMTGIGLRITKAAKNNYYCTQTWEVERHAGVAAANRTDGETIGTYAWERDYGAENVGDLPLGVPRMMSSTERQYWPEDGWTDPVGVIRSWQSSVDSLLIWDVVGVHTPTLLDDRTCTPEMLPAQLHKYLGYYVLSMAFNRQGEGYDPNLAGHWELRWQRAYRLMNRLKEPTWRDQQFRRQPQRGRRGRVPQPTLPPDYPAVPWLNPL